MDGTHDGAASVDNVAHRPHDNGRCSSIQPCESGTMIGTEVPHGVGY